MKKIILIIILTTFYVTLFSQIRMGITGGTDISWLRLDNAKVKNNRAVVGFQYGLLTDYFFSERYSISTGVFIHHTGGKLSYSDSLYFNTKSEKIALKPDSRIRYKLQYLEVPLALHLESNKIGYFVYHAQFGITNFVRIGAKSEIDQLNNEKQDCKKEIGLYTMGYNVGGGINYFLSKNTALTCSIIFTSSFVDVMPKQFQHTSINNVALRVGVIF